MSCLSRRVSLAVPIFVALLAVRCAAPPAPTALADPAALTPAQREQLRHTAAAEVYRLCHDSVVNIGTTRIEETRTPASANPAPAPAPGPAPTPAAPGTQPASPAATTQPATRPALPATRPAMNVTRTTRIEYGSGVVLHEAGYVLTNCHVVKSDGRRRLGFDGGPEFDIRVVAADAARDLAIVKIDADRAFKPVTLGKSRELIVGEPVMVMGNPFGMGLTLTVGMVSALNRATRTEFTSFTGMIQIDAGTNPGVSGGPLLNVAGELIGINTTKKTEGDNIGFAIPVDKIRAALPEMLAAEQRYGFVMGMQVDSGGEAKVTQVEADSPAAAAGVQTGDVVTQLGKLPVRQDTDYHLALTECRAERAVPLRVRRGAKELELTVLPAGAPLRPAEQISGLTTGLSSQFYRGRWSALPDFASLRPAGTGKAATLSPDAAPAPTFFALRFTGYLHVPSDGVYTFYASSKDGSRLFIGDKLVVDNNGRHPPLERCGFISLQAGYHPLTVLYFQSDGDKALQVSYEGPGLSKQPVPAAALWRKDGP